MELRNCPKCGKMFQCINAPVCDACIQKEEEKYLELKQFIIDNPDKKMAEVAKTVGVPVKKIMLYIQEGRLVIMGDSAMASEVTCGTCGKPIEKGRYCESCSNKISADMETVFPTQQNKVFTAKKEGPRMHTRR